MKETFGSAKDLLEVQKNSAVLFMQKTMRRTRSLSQGGQERANQIDRHDDNFGGRARGNDNSGDLGNDGRSQGWFDRDRRGQNISYVGVEETVDGIEQLVMKEAKLDVQEDSVVDLTLLLS